MTVSETKELRAREKQEVTSSAEQTEPGLVFTPAVDILESETEITLLADMPGVKPDDVGIDLKENTLTLTGEIAPFEGGDEEDILIEYEVGEYYRRFTLTNDIDQNKIEAQIKDGVLRLVLPKMEKPQPGKITVKAA